MDCVTTSLQMKIECFFCPRPSEMQGHWANLENSFWWSGGRFPQNLGGERGRPMHPSPNILHPSPNVTEKKFKGKMTKKVVRNSENVDIFGGPRTETKFVKWSATRKRLRTAAICKPYM